MEKKSGKRKRTKAPPTHMRKREQELKRTHAQRQGNGKNRDGPESKKQRRLDAIMNAKGEDDMQKVDELVNDESEVVEEKWQQTYRQRAALYWDSVYRNKTVNYFKDRHYFSDEFPELCESPEQAVVLLELGCGVGNSVFPLLEENPNLFVLACDLSAEAIALLQQKLLQLEAAAESKGGSKEEQEQQEQEKSNFNPRTTRCVAFRCDITIAPLDTAEASATSTDAGKVDSRLVSPSLEESLQQLGRRCPFIEARSWMRGGEQQQDVDQREGETGSTEIVLAPAPRLDFVTMVFVLSAIAPEKAAPLLDRLHATLRPGGIVLFRDYGYCDLNQLRFQGHQRLSRNFYVRGDGTMAYFFEVDVLRQLFENAGFEVLQCEYRNIEKNNRKKGLTMKRIWVQGKFRRKKT